MSEPEMNRAEAEPDEDPMFGSSADKSSEYRFTRDQIYSDAHYEPAGSST